MRYIITLRKGILMIKKMILMLVLITASACFGRDRYGGGSTYSSPTILVAASNSSAAEIAAATYTCDGTDDNVEIQAAIDALAVTGGEIQLAAGTYTLSASIVPKSGVNIRGSGVKTSQTHYFDGTADIDGGTIITGDVVVFDCNQESTFVISDMGFENVSGVVRTGGSDVYGMQNVRFENILIDTTGEIAFYFCNSQHITFDNVKILNLGGTRTGSERICGLHFKSDNSTGFQPGNSIFKDFYIMRNKTNDAASNIDGILIENAGTSGGVCYLTFIKPQVNMWAGVPKNVFTVNTSTDILTATDTMQFANGDAILITAPSGGGLTIANCVYRQNYVYYVRDVSGNTFKIAATSGGAALDITASSGTLTARKSGAARYCVRYLPTYAAYFVGHSWTGLDLEGSSDYAFYGNYLLNCTIQYHGTSSTESFMYHTYLGVNSKYNKVFAPSSLGNVSINSRSDVWIDKPGMSYSTYGDDLSALTVKLDYMNNFNQCYLGSTSTFNLPLVDQSMAGQKVFIEKITAAAQATVAASPVTPELYGAGNELVWNSGDPYINLGGCPCWSTIAATSNAFQNYLCYVAGVTDVNVVDGWYVATSSNNGVLRFINADGVNGDAIVNDGGIKVGNYNAKVQIYNSISVDGVPTASFTDINEVGEWAEFVCNGKNGWICTNKYTK
jgi:hypothetical protein